MITRSRSHVRMSTLLVERLLNQQWIILFDFSFSYLQISHRLLFATSDVKKANPGKATQISSTSWAPAKSTPDSRSFVLAAIVWCVQSDWNIHSEETSTLLQLSADAQNHPGLSWNSTVPPAILAKQQMQRKLLSILLFHVAPYGWPATSWSRAIVQHGYFTQNKFYSIFWCDSNTGSSPDIL